MSFKEGLVTVGTALFVCSGTIGIMGFVALYYFIMGLGE